MLVARGTQPYCGAVGFPLPNAKRTWIAGARSRRLHAAAAPCSRRSSGGALGPAAAARAPASLHHPWLCAAPPPWRSAGGAGCNELGWVWVRSALGWGWGRPHDTRHHLRNQGLAAAAAGAICTTGEYAPGRPQQHGWAAGAGGAKSTLPHLSSCSNQLMMSAVVRQHQAVSGADHAGAHAGSQQRPHLRFR